MFFIESEIHFVNPQNKEVRREKAKQASLSELNQLFRTQLNARRINIHIDWTYRMTRSIELIENVLFWIQNFTYRLQTVKIFVEPWPGVMNSKNKLDSHLIPFFKFCMVKGISIEVEVSSERGLHQAKRVKIVLIKIFFFAESLFCI